MATTKRVDTFPKKTAPAIADELILWSASDAAVRNVTVGDLGEGIVSVAEKAAWNGKADAHSHPYEAAGAVAAHAAVHAPADANNYVHPVNHAPSIITQDSNNRFVTDEEKATWNGKETTSGAQDKVDTHAALTGTNAHGLKTAATRDVGLAAGNVMEVGAFGLGMQAGESWSAAGYNLNNTAATGYYSIEGSSAVNAPAAVFGVLHHLQSADPTYASQEFLGVSSTHSWRRNKIAGSWGAWRLVFTQTNILGGVGQSAGVPTGSIIERGSNANGEYVRYADGTQITTRRYTYTAAIATANGSVYIGSALELSFAAAFSETPVVSLAAVGESGTISLMGGAVGLTSATFYPWRPNAATESTNVYIIAIGRWF